MLPAPLLLATLWLAPNGDTSPDVAKGAALYRGCQAELRLMNPGALPEASQGDLVNGTYCIGYLNGFVANLPAAGGAFCVADQPMGVLVRVYVDFLDHHPAFLEQDKRLGVRAAFEAAFPCPAPVATQPGTGPGPLKRL